MSRTVTIDPLTRIEGHLAIKLTVEDGRVSEAFCVGEMFRGFETILMGRHPMDAQQITQRICGVCPIAHGTASILAQDMAYGVTPPPNGRLLRNLILGANYVQSHILHFYHLAALDFVDITAVAQYAGADPMLTGLRDWVKAQLSSSALYPAAPFLPRFEGSYLEDHELNVSAVKHYLEGLDMRRLAHETAAIFCGKIPHATALVPGGVTEKATARKLAAYTSNMQQLLTFIDHCYVPDVLAVAAALPDYFNVGAGCGNFLSYGVFHESADGARKLLPSGILEQGKHGELDQGRISEQVRHSLFSSGTGLHPARGETTPAPDKSGAYSWLKAPRYNGQVMEVGPLARVLMAYSAGMPQVKTLVDTVLSRLGAGPEALDSVLGRHAARAIECKIIAERCLEWAEQVRPGEATYTDFELPENAVGHGLTEAPRGALGHWIDIADHKIKNYQCVVPTTWNCSPRDDRGNPGPVEIALVGTPIADEKHPIEAARVVRSFDPCIACAVH